VIYPVTTLRLAMKAIEDGLTTIAREGSQESIVVDMQSRKRLYELLSYDKYAAIDEAIFNFRL
jgi:methylisocitrate lyase